MMAAFVSSLAGVLSGSLVGFSLGLIGGGGSVLATPLMLYVVGVPQTHVAIGTSAFAVSVNAFLGFLTHARGRTVRWRAALIFAAVGIIGALAGSTLGKALDGERLLFLFGLAMVVVGIAMLRGGHGGANNVETRIVATDFRVGSAAFFTGLVSGFFGIGGGILIVPALTFATGMAMINAVGSSLLAVGALGLTTAVNYAASRLVDWKLALEFICGGLVGGYFGARLAMHLGERREALRRIFAITIFVVAAYVLLRSGRSVFS